jgi:hypothetical protein
VGLEVSEGNGQNLHGLTTTQAMPLSIALLTRDRGFLVIPPVSDFRG